MSGVDYHKKRLPNLLDDTWRNSAHLLIFFVL
jgi:hypothetical protein